MVKVRTLIVCVICTHTILFVFLHLQTAVLLFVGIALLSNNCCECCLFVKYPVDVFQRSWLATAYVTVVVKKTDTSYFYSMGAEIYLNFCIVNFLKR